MSGQKGLFIIGIIGFAVATIIFLFDKDAGWIPLGLGLLSITVSCFLALSSAAKENKSSAFTIGYFGGAYAIAGLLCLAFASAGLGYILLIVAVLMVIYGLYARDEKKLGEQDGEYEPERISFTNPPRKSVSPPTAKPVNEPVNDDDPAGIRPYVNRK